MLDQTTIRSFIPARIGPVWLLLEAREVQEIVGVRAWVPVPHSSHLVPGVLAWRGRAVAVFDLAVLALAGDRLSPAAHRPRTLIVETTGCLLAMPVDGVREVQEIEGSRVNSSRVTRISHCSTEVEVFGTLAPIVDLASLVSSVLAEGADAEGRTGTHAT